MKNIKRIGIILLIIVFILGMSNVFAIDMSGLEKISDPTGVSSLTDISGKIIGVIYYIGMAVSIGMIIFIGIKYLMATPEGKADYKSRAIPYIIGAVLIFGAANILKFIQSMSTWIKQ